MLAGVLTKPGVLEVKSIKTPRPKKGELLVKIRAALTCGTDLKAFQRGHPMIPLPSLFGHEFAGTVEQSGGNTGKFSKGMDIMSVHSAPCLKCGFCRKSFFNLCEKIMKTKILGAFSEYIILPEHIVRQNVYRKPSNISFEEAAFLEPLSCVIHSIGCSGIKQGDNALVIGAGAVGLLHMMVLKTMGIRVIVMEKHRGRLRKARELGAHDVIDPYKRSDQKKIETLEKKAGTDVVYECTGVPGIWEDSVWFVRRGGTVILFGGCAAGTQVSYDTGRIHYDEITLKGVFHYTPEDVSNAYKLLTKRKICVTGLISGHYSLQSLMTPFNRLLKGEGIKYAIIPK